MGKLSKRELLTRHLGTPDRQSDEFLFPCPSCKGFKKKLSVNFDKNVFKCWVCNYSGKDIRYLIRDHIGGLVDWESNDEVTLESFQKIFYKEKANLEEKKTFFPDNFIPMTTEIETPLFERAVSFLKQRGIARKDMIRWRIGFCEGDNLYGRIIIPSFDIEGDCNFYVARTFIGQKTKYWTPATSKKSIIFNEIDIDWTQPITLVEGVFDAIKAGDNAIPLLGSSLPRKGSKLFSELIKRATKVYLALDNEKSAKSSANKIASSLLKHKIEVRMVELGDYNDPGEMTKEQFQKCKEAAKEFNFFTSLKEALK